VSRLTTPTVAHPQSVDELVDLWRALDESAERLALTPASRRHMPPFMVVAYVATAAIMASILVSTIWVIRVIGQV
jgi:hypothetical protein